MADRRKAVALAGHRGDEPYARQALDDPVPSVRAAALGALARMAKLQVEDVARSLDDLSAVVRRRACEVAVDVPDPSRRVPGILVAALSDPDPWVIESACFALGEGGIKSDRAVPHVAEIATKHPDPLCREAAVAALGAIGDRRGLAAIFLGTGDKAAVRRRAVLALAAFEGPDVDAALARASQDRDWQVRQAAQDLRSR